MKRALIFIPLYLSLTCSYAQQLDSTQVKQLSENARAKNNNKKKGVAILPATLYFTADRGQTQTLNINFDNTLDSPVQFKVSLTDFIRDENSNVTYMEPGKHPRSCATWLKLSNNFIEIPGNTIGILPVTIQVPDSEAAISEMKWAMIFLEGMKEKVANQKSGNIDASVEKSYRVGVQVYQTPPTVLSKDLKMTSFTPMLERGQYRVTCKNQGSVLLRCISYIELLSKESGEKITVYPGKEGKDPFKILPDQVRNIDFIIPDTVPKGKYTAVAMIDANDDEVPLEAAQLEIELK